MKVTREQAAENRERIIKIAARLFREKGFDGIGVADLMKSAGLTHGGFYGHFASKSDLAAKACERALEHSVEKWSRLADEAGEDALSAMATNYVCEAHRDRPGGGCVFAALGPDAARQEAPVKRALTAGLTGLIEVLERAVPGETEADRRRAALAAMAQMTGAVMLSRIVDDEAFSKEILDATLADLKDRANSGRGFG
jgi:TetR/AcrR family transcriptional regulator, transcriptional repressor for nem operon